MKTRKRAVAADSDRLKDVARRILERLELALTQNDSDVKPEDHDWLFGKHSLLSALDVLIELFLKLDENQAEKPAAENVSLTSVDVALVEEFIRKAKAT